MKFIYLLMAVVLALVAVRTDAAVTPNSFVSAQTPTRGIVQFLQGTDVAGTYKTLYTAGSNGSRCNAIWLTHDDQTNTHLINVQIVSSSVKYGGPQYTTVVSGGAGLFITPINLMTAAIWPGLPTDSDGNPYVQLASGDTLQATFATALVTSGVINIVVSCADF